MDDGVRHAAQRSAAADSVRQLRTRLLDLTARNPLISFRHSEGRGARVHVRAVNARISDLLDPLIDGRPLPIAPLPHSPNEPQDERSEAFVAALEAARPLDEEYQAALEDLGDSDTGSAKAARIERELRDRVRESLGMRSATGAQQEGLAEYARKLGIDPSFDLPMEQPVQDQSARATPAEFQTLLLADALDRHLSKVRDTARTVVEETGVSTLHLGVGFLEWFESEDSDRAILSPLLLMRVDIDRKIVRSRYQYSLTSTGDEPQANLTLSERLYRDFNLRLPEWKDGDAPEEYLARVQQDMCKDRQRWRVQYYVTLSHFPFARLAMFHDLDEAGWEHSGGLGSHAILGQLLGGSEISSSSMFADEHEIDNPNVAATVPILILDADASQHSAVFEAMSGKNLVIEGPPGTGKSQTIANIVGAALAGGKRVLFMADKQAALQVVKDRLDRVGLGDFCLELHSGKARKSDVLDALKARLERRHAKPDMAALDDKLRLLAETRDALTNYVTLLNASLGALGASIHEVLWRDRARRHQEGTEAGCLDSITLPEADHLTGPDIDRRRAVLTRFEDAAAPIIDKFGDMSAHPWHGVTSSSLPSVAFEDVVRDATEIAHLMEQVQQDAIALIPPLGGQTIGGLQAALQGMASLPLSDEIDTTFYRALASPESRLAAAAWERACSAYRDAVRALQAHGLSSRGAGDTAAAETLDECRKELADFAEPGLTVRDLPEWSAASRNEAARLDSLLGLANNAAQLLGTPEPTRVGDIEIVVRAVGRVAETDPAVLASLSPELTDASNQPLIATAAAQIAALQARAASLAAEFSIPPDTKPDTLRGHASVLREAGPLGFLQLSVRAATRCHGRLRKGRAKPGRAKMAAALVSIAEYLEALDAWKGNRAYAGIFGRNFRDLDTDANAALAAAQWAADVRSDFPISDPLSWAMRECLLAADRDRLEALAALGAKPAFAELRAYIAQQHDSSAPAGLPAQQLERRSAKVDCLATECGRAGIPGTASLSSLRSLCDLLRKAGAAEAGAQAPAVLSSTLSEELPRPLDDHTKLQSALALADAVARLPISPEARAFVHAMEPPAVADLAASATAGSQALEYALLRWHGLVGALKLAEDAFLGASLAESRPGCVAQRLRHGATHSADLGAWVSYLIERDEAESLGLRDILALWDQKVTTRPLPDVFERVLYRALARLAYARHPELDRFTGLRQDEARAKFKRLDGELTALKRAILASRLLAKQVPAGNGVGKRSDYTDQQLILLEISKQKRHIPIRQLLDRAGKAVQALKPCFMMSPLSVSQYLKPGGVSFDLLVIDEASQMRPEDALVGIARSAQIVVVGDRNQLPPTAFFDRLENGGNDDEPDEEIDAESILDLAQSVFRPMRRLRWHYRSRHGSLVAFSNREFYDDDLIVFPSPTEAGPTQGVSVTKVDGVYKARSNLAEVEMVCDAVVEHMRAHPDRSLGVATMNQVQRELLAAEMDRRTMLFPEVQAYKERWAESLERFFVKNLENVQGDERDVIFISTVFGPPEPGARVRQTFGPINGKSGHRRLNVLFTRAKHQIRLFHLHDTGRRANRSG